MHFPLLAIVLLLLVVVEDGSEWTGGDEEKVLPTYGGVTHSEFRGNGPRTASR